MTNDDGRSPKGRRSAPPKLVQAPLRTLKGMGRSVFPFRRKLAVVARLLRGEPLELVARETNVSVAKLTEWRDRALSGAATAMKERERDDRDEEIAPAEVEGGRDHHGQRAARQQDRGDRGWAPFGAQEVETMSRALSPPLPLLWSGACRACVAHLPRQRLSPSQRRPNTPPRRPGPVGACSDAALLDHIRPQIPPPACTARATAKSGRGCAMPGSARPRRMRRVMGQHGLLAPHRVGRPETAPHDGTITTTR